VEIIKRKENNSLFSFVHNHAQRRRHRPPHQGPGRAATTAPSSHTATTSPLRRAAAAAEVISGFADLGELLLGSRPSFSNLRPEPRQQCQILHRDQNSTGRHPPQVRLLRSLFCSHVALALPDGLASRMKRLVPVAAWYTTSSVGSISSLTSIVCIFRFLSQV
jgi:hypothetical protein